LIGRGFLLVWRVLYIYVSSLYLLSYVCFLFARFVLYTFIVSSLCPFCVSCLIVLPSISLLFIRFVLYVLLVCLFCFPIMLLSVSFCFLFRPVLCYPFVPFFSPGASVASCLISLSFRFSSRCVDPCLFVLSYICVLFIRLFLYMCLVNTCCLVCFFCLYVLSYNMCLAC